MTTQTITEVEFLAQSALGNNLAIEREEAVQTLLRGVPQSGGSVRRQTLENLVRSAFLGGIVATVKAGERKGLL